MLPKPGHLAEVYVAVLRGSSHGHPERPPLTVLILSMAILTVVSQPL
jgi:hypothetical protein